MMQHLESSICRLNEGTENLTATMDCVVPLSRVHAVTRRDFVKQARWHRRRWISSFIAPTICSAG